MPNGYCQKTETTTTTLTTTTAATTLNPLCNPNPCQNGGVCVLLDETFECDCPFGFTGSFCEILRWANECCLAQNGLFKG